MAENEIKLSDGVGVDVIKQGAELRVREVESLATLASATNAIANFLTGGGLSNLLSGYAKSQSVTAMLGGLTAHAGRNGLDARVLAQNAVEIVEQIELVHKKYSERLQEKERDPEVKDAEVDFKKWQEKVNE